MAHIDCPQCGREGTAYVAGANYWRYSCAKHHSWQINYCAVCAHVGHTGTPCNNDECPCDASWVATQ